MSEKVYMGFCEESITPDKTISLTGQFFERISEYVETPITATAMAVKAGNEQMVIVSCDLTLIGESFIDALRERIAGYKDLDVNKVMLNATHTHTSHTFISHKRIPAESSLKALEKYSGGIEYKELTGDKKPEMNATEATEFLLERISAAIKTAWDNLHPVYYQFGFGRAAIGLCRRAVYDDGSAQMWGDTNEANFKELESGNDSGIEMGFIFDQNKKLECVMLNVACPSQIVEQRSFISSDYWGKVKVLLREKFGEDLKVLGLCSPAGDLCPRDLIRWVEPETPIDDPNVNRPRPLERRADPSMYDIKGTWRAGKRIAHEVIDTFEELSELGELQDTAEFEHEVLTVDFPLRRVTMSDRDNAIRAIKEFFRDFKGDSLTYTDNARMHVHAGTIARYEDQQRIDIYPMEVHVIRFGDIAIATNPFELFHDYANQIRARSFAKQTFLIQLCNGANGYLPTEKAEKGSHYSAYVTSGTVGHEGGELLVRETLKSINEKFAK